MKTKIILIILFEFIFSFKNFSQEKIFIELKQNNLASSRSNISYRVINKSNKKITYFVGIEIFTRNEWNPYQIDITVKNGLRKARILTLKPNSNIYKNHSLYNVFCNDVYDFYKKDKFRLVIQYKYSRKDSIWSYASSKEFTLK